MEQFQAIQALLGDSLPVYILDRGRWAEARIALVLAKQCHLVSQDLHRLRLQWLACPKIRPTEDGKADRRRQPLGWPDHSAFGKERALRRLWCFWGLWGGCRAMLTQLVPKLSA